MCCKIQVDNTWFDKLFQNMVLVVEKYHFATIPQTIKKAYSRG